MDYFVLACEVLFILFTVYYTIEEVIEITRFKFHYFKAIWNVLDVIIILISYVCIAFNIYRLVKIGAILDNLLRKEDTFADFEFLTYWQIQFNNIVAFAVFLAWIKVNRLSLSVRPETTIRSFRFSNTSLSIRR